MSDDRTPIGHISVERERADVKIVIEDEDETEVGYFYVPPEFAVQLAVWLQQAASDAKRYEQAAREDA